MASVPTIRGVTQRTLRWPILFAVCLILALELCAYALIRSFVLLYEWASNIGRRHAAIKDRLLNASAFTDWCRAARELDQAEGRDQWKKDPSSPYYDPELITNHLQSLRQHRTAGDMKRLMKNLKTIYSQYNFGGMNNSQLYNQTNFGTKILVQDFIQVTHTLHTAAALPHTAPPPYTASHLTPPPPLSRACAGGARVHDSRAGQ
jgi:hypothetical protein